MRLTMVRKIEKSDIRKIGKSGIKKLKKGLIASCQPIPKGPLDNKEIILAMCKASIIGGAKGLRIEGLKNVQFIKKKLNIPIIGIIKRNLKKYPIIITPFLKDIDDLASAGVDIIAFDATLRKRPFMIQEMIERAQKRIAELELLIRHWKKQKEET